jgi:hypothetical protein
MIEILNKNKLIYEKLINDKTINEYFEKNLIEKLDINQYDNRMIIENKENIILNELNKLLRYLVIIIKSNFVNTFEEENFEIFSKIIYVLMMKDYLKNEIYLFIKEYLLNSLFKNEDDEKRIQFFEFLFFNKSNIKTYLNLLFNFDNIEENENGNTFFNIQKKMKK